MSLTVEQGFARLWDPDSGRATFLTEIEGRLLEQYAGQAPEELARAVQAAGLGLWPEQVRAVLERVSAAGFLSEPLSPGLPVSPPLQWTDAVPVFRSDLMLTGTPGASAAFQVYDPTTQLSFSLFDSELTVARLLTGTRSVGELIAFASQVGITVTSQSLERYVRQLRAFNFLETDEGAGVPSTWPPRNDWGREVRELYQSALRLLRSGHAQQAQSYLDTIEQLAPNLPEALELRARVQSALDGVPDGALPFELLHGSPAAPAPPPPPDEDFPEIQETSAPPPAVARIEGLGLLPAPGELPPSPVPSVPRSTMMFAMTPEGKPGPAPEAQAAEAAIKAAMPSAPFVPPVRTRSLEAPPRASPPPRGAESLARPLLSGIDADLPVISSAPPSPLEEEIPSVEAQLADLPPAVHPWASVQVDSIAFVPQVKSVEVDPSMVSGQDDRAAATTLDGGPSHGSVGSLDRVPELPAPALSPTAPSQRKKSNRGRVLAVVGVLVTMVAGGMAVPVPRTVTASCTLTPLVKGEPTVEADGQVAETLVKDGDLVSKGAVLARITVAEDEQMVALAQKEAAARAKAERLKATASKTPRAKKAAVALAKKDKELAKLKAAQQKLEAGKKVPPAALAKAKKAVEAKQKERDKAEAALDVETAAPQRAALEVEAQAAAEARAKLQQESAGGTVTAPETGRFVAPAKHAAGMGLKAGERYGRVVDPGMWKVTVENAPAATEPRTASVYLENGRIIELEGGTLTGEGGVRRLEGTALLTDDAFAAGKPTVKFRAGRRPLAVVLLGLAR